jgi:hypothetical protein
LAASTAFRLKEGLGLSDTAVSRSVRIARSTVKEYLDRAARTRFQLLLRLNPPRT